MALQKSLKRRLLLVSILLSGCPMFMQTPAYAEPYIAGQFGVNFPGSISDYKLTTALPPGTSVSGPVVKDLTDAFMVGGKLGIYSQTIRWFGLETEVFRTNPHFKPEVSTVTGPGGSVQTTTAGSQLSVITWAPLNLMFRYPAKRLQPYVGIGPGVFFANRSTLGTNESQSNTKIGLNAEVGLRYFMSRNWALFGEYKFNYVHFNFTESPMALDGFKGNYTANIFALGLSYHF
ncbi:MAG TPA: outer membrane beta-barrel protein [Nitrospiraceae bacterium]|nr:outer membrane beta-barrel protein [Nitrospiraceae bacterium]